jgi:alpha-beta hydrolase superfamily lysophospholipase
MGSFFGRWFAEKYPDALDALVISGTGGPGALMKIGKAMAGFFTRVKGPRYVSQFMVKASMGSYSKGIEDDRSKNVWLSRDPAVWEAYDKDPKCTFPFTVSAFRDMLTVHVHVNTPEWAGNLRKDLPVYVYSGDMDPVGEYGKGVRAVEQLLRDAKLQDVTMRLYPQGRHEMHNELNKDEVFRDLIAWCDAHI